MAELEQAGGAKRAPKLAERLDAGRGAFERERYQDARRILSKLAREAPGAASVRELHGLTLYRLERWKQAAAELEAYRAITGSADQDPVLADCYRALRRYGRVEELWDELREASPSAALVTEGRIVAAGARADQGDLQGAIALLVRAVAEAQGSASTTCASGTPWPTSTTAPATSPRPGACSGRCWPTSPASPTPSSAWPPSAELTRRLPAPTRSARRIDARVGTAPQCGARGPRRGHGSSDVQHRPS